MAVLLGVEVGIGSVVINEKAHGLNPGTWCWICVGRLGFNDGCLVPCRREVRVRGASDTTTLLMTDAIAVDLPRWIRSVRCF